MTSPHMPERPAIDSRAVAFWRTPTLALLFESQPGELTLEFERLLKRRSRQPLIAVYGFPDFRAVRREMNLSVCDVARRWDVPASVVRGVEFGWKPLTLGAALWCCERLSVPIGALFHDAQFEQRPLTRIYSAFLRDDLDQVQI